MIKTNKSFNKLFIILFLILGLILIVSNQFLLTLDLGFTYDYSFASIVNLSVLSFVSFLLLIFKKDTFPLIALLLIFPIVIMDLSIFNNTLVLLILFGVNTLGMLIHFLRFKPKFNLGSFFIAIILLLLAFTLSELQTIKGININILIICLFLILAYTFITSSIIKPKKRDVSFLVIMYELTLLLFLYLEWRFEFIVKPYSGLLNRNYISLVTLVTIAFCLYNLITFKQKKDIMSFIFSIILFSVLSFVYIVMYARLLLLLLIITLMFLVGLRKSKNKILSIITIASCFMFTLSLGLLQVNFDFSLYLNDIKEYYNSLANQELTWNGWFGSGITEYINNISKESSTLIEQINTYSGVIGLIGFGLFTFIKYFKLLRIKTTGSLTCAISLFAIGIYNLIYPQFLNLPCLVFIIFLLASLEYQVNEVLLCEYGD